MHDSNNGSADVRLRIEGVIFEFIESQRRQQLKIPSRIEIIRQLLKKAIAAEGKKPTSA